MPNWRFDGLLDPQAGIFFERELTAVREEVLQMERRPRNGFAFIPQMDDVDDSFRTYEHRMWDAVGIADWIADAADDLPMVDAAGQAETFNIRWFGCAYRFSVQEVAANARLGRGLDRMRVLAARLVTEEKFNRVMFFGDTSEQLFGLLNYPFIPRRLSTVRLDDAGQTPQARLAEMNAIVNTPYNNTGTVARPNFLGLAPTMYTAVVETPMGDGDNTTILETFLRTNPWFKEGRGTVEPLHELEGAGPNGEDMATAYERVPEVVQHKLARPFTQRSPQERNLAIVTPCHAATGGIASDQPLHAVNVEFPAAA